MTPYPKIIICPDCTTDHPEGQPCPNCEAWARIATKARKARKEWVFKTQLRDVRQPHND